MKNIFLTALFFILSISVFAQARIDSKVGTVSSSKGKSCLAIQNNRLKKGERVSIVFAYKPQSVKTANVLKKVSANCSNNTEANENDSFYLLQASKRNNELYIATGIVRAGTVSAAQGVASADLNGDRKKEYFRACTSSEGVHLTVWTGKPLAGKRIWHSYYYLNYDTEPTCNEKDYEETDE